MRISSEEYKGLRNRVYEIIENEVWAIGSIGDVSGISEATEQIFEKVIDQLVKIKEITY